jgi:hypothetical protein
MKRGAIYGQITDTGCVKHKTETGTNRNWVSLAGLHNCS